MVEVRKAFRQRLREVLVSVYLHNEHRGYTQLDRLLDAVRRRYPEDTAFLAAVTRHRDDERNHYRMFRSWFRARECMPFRVPAACGYVDTLVRRVFGCPLDDLDHDRLVGDEGAFRGLCRLIMVTERRGLRQVEAVLRWAVVQEDPRLQRIFTVIREDEPAHVYPYEDWLTARGDQRVRRRERMADRITHADLLYLRIPGLVVNPFLRRLEAFPA